MTVFSKNDTILEYCEIINCDDDCKIKHICERIDGQFIDDEEACNEALTIICEAEDNPIKPSYYHDSKITPFDVIDDWDLNFYLGNAVKYIKRAGKKADNSRLQDLKKIREYIDHEIKSEEVLNND